MAPAVALTSLGVTIATASDSTRVVAAIGSVFNYQALIPQITGPPIPNPETPEQFAQRMIVVTVKSWVKTYEVQQAENAAAITAGATADQVGVS